MFRSVVFSVRWDVRILVLASREGCLLLYTRRISVVRSMEGSCGGWAFRLLDRMLLVVVRVWMRMCSRMKVPWLVRREDELATK